MNYTRERLEDFLNKLNQEFQSGFSEVKEVGTPYIEKEDGTRFAVQTIYKRIPPEDLNCMEDIGRKLISNIMKEVGPSDTLYMRQDWYLMIQDPSLTCPYTFDLLDKPTEGVYILMARFRIVGNKDAVCLRHLNCVKGEGNKYRNWIE